MQLLFMLLSNVYDVFHILIYIVRFGFPNLMSNSSNCCLTFLSKSDTAFTPKY